MALKNLFSGTGTAIKAVASGTSAATAKLSEKFDDIMFVALKVVVMSVAVAAVHKYAGLKAGEDMQAWYIYFGLGVVAVGFEYYGAQFAVNGWYNRALGTVILGGGLCLTGLAFSYSNAIGSAAVQQSQAAGVQKAAFHKTVDSRAVVTNLEKQLSMLQAKHDWSKNLDAPDSYDARITAAEEDAKYEATRKGCKSKCIAKQQLAASLKAEKANAVDRAVTAEEIKVVQSKLDEAMTVAANAPTTVSEVRADVLEYANWFGTDAQTGQVMQARHVALTITIFVTLTGFFSALKRNQGRTPKPWGFIAKMRRRFHRLWNGSDEGFVETASHNEVHNHVTISDETAIAKLRQAAEAMRNMTAPQGLAAA